MASGPFSGRDDEIDTGTLRSIADQAGAKDFQEFKDWIERNR